jgi:hypothetical protein
VTAGTVYLDGERLGEVRAGGRVVLDDVYPGSRSIEIRYTKGEKETTTTSVRAGDTSTAAFTYVQATAASRPLRDEILVEGGVFTMGSPSGGNDDERPMRVGGTRIFNRPIGTRSCL